MSDQRRMAICCGLYDHILFYHYTQLLIDMKKPLTFLDLSLNFINLSHPILLNYGNSVHKPAQP